MSALAQLAKPGKFIVALGKLCDALSGSETGSPSRTESDLHVGRTAQACDHRDSAYSCVRARKRDEISFSTIEGVLE